MNKEQTIFQRLTSVFTPYGIDQNKLSNKYSIQPDEILRTTSKAEFETKTLQARQNKFLGGLWQKVENETFQKAVQYEISRIGGYSDFENMEFYPEIAATLDIMSEESTTVNDIGRVLNIYSNSPRVKGILEDLFFNRLDIHTSLPMWIRNLVKYGDNFVFLNTDDTRGVTGAKQLPNFEIERREGGVYDAVYSRAVNSSEDRDDKVNFYWRGKDLQFQNWQIAHFRLLGDDRRLPYGTSILEKARRIWKLLMLSEDAMLVYRITRAPERRVYKIFVGNIDPEDVQSYINEIANRFKRMPVIDPKTGQLDLRMNVLGNDQDIFVPVREESSPSPIETLPGASNLGEIADIEYLQRKLFTALRVPKAFLGFDEAQGEGKNLALLDIRFARTINRIQQAVIQELNKIAIIHLLLLGFDDELDNFTITMNNPSTQAQMLRIQNLQQKVTLVKDAVSDIGNGFGTMSLTRARRDILGWSDDDNRQDLLEQRMEKAASAELANTANVIKYTGVFDKVDKLYGDIEIAKMGGVLPEGGEDGEAADTGGGGGGGGGGGFGGGLDLGGGSDVGFEEAQGEEAVGEEIPSPNEGEAVPEAPATETVPEIGESLIRTEKLLTEEIIKLKKQVQPRIDKYKDIYMNRLLESIKTPSEDAKINENKVKMYDKGFKLNNEINEILKDIDGVIKQK
jgi:hypothetical protein